MALTWSSEDDPIVWARIYIHLVILESEDGGDDDDEVLVAS